MIRSLRSRIWRRRWSRDRAVDAAAVLRGESKSELADLRQIEAMALQLAEIRALPEAREPIR